MRDDTMQFNLAGFACARVGKIYRPHYQNHIDLSLRLNAVFDRSPSDFALFALWKSKNSPAGNNIITRFICTNAEEYIIPQRV